MAVSRAWQGKGIGTRLIDKCLETAREWKLEKVTLYSNSQLKVALGIYKKYGFVDVPLIDSPLLTADVRMELVLQ
jgi:ribosomal protein S18 acetylase RimI-like enzyme